MPTTYPFDPTGTLVSNRISGEQHIITPVNFKDYHFIVPNLAPFFANTLQITFRDTNNNTVTLVEGVDWYLSHWFISASRACSKPIYGSISILNRNLAGVLTLRYQTLGGDWNIDDTLLANILADRIHNPRTTSWDSVSEMPYSFPVIDHEWDLVDMVGMSEVVERLDDIQNAILATSEGGLDYHILDYGNPHKVNATQIGLGFVRNLSTAVETEAYETLNDARYTTPWSVHLAITRRLDESGFAPHVANRNNPHNVTADQTGSFTKDAVTSLLGDKLDLNGTAVDTLKFGGMTPDEWINSFSVGSVDNANKFNDMTYSEVVDDILAQTIANSLLLDGKTYEELKDEWESVEATNAEKLEGMTIDEIRDDFSNYFLTGSSITSNARQYTFFRAYPDPTDTNPYIWTKIATVNINELINPEYRYSKSEFLLSGGLGAQDNNTSLLHIKASTIGSETNGLQLGITSLDTETVASELKFGYTFERNPELEPEEDHFEGTFTIWVRTKLDRSSLVITVLNSGSFNFEYTSEEPVKIEPVGITYTNSINGHVYIDKYNNLIDSLTDVFNDLNNP